MGQFQEILGVQNGKTGRMETEWVGKSARFSVLGNRAVPFGEGGGGTGTETTR